MGLNLTVVMADWKRLREIPVEERVEALEDAIWPEGIAEDYVPQDTTTGWVWPGGQEPVWCAEFVFDTTGSYRWHSRAGDAWADMRALADATLREAVDSFLDGLIWDKDPDEAATLTGADGVFPPAADRLKPHLLLVCPPEKMPGKAAAWKQAAPRLEELRGPFAAECEGWAGRPDTFEEFLARIGEWGEVVTETARRGWGLVGLPD